MKLRLIAMGSIISVLGVFLLVSRGYSPELLGLLVVGLVLLVIGTLWKKPKSADAAQRETR